MSDPPPVEKSVVLACDPAHAFALFTERAGEWWPDDRRHTGDAASTIRIESSGRFFERSHDGTEIELGLVRAYEPARRLVLDWYPGTGRDNPTLVEIRFDAVAEGTRVLVVHGPGSSDAATFRRTAPAYDRSWDLVLQGVRMATKTAAGTKGAPWTLKTPPGTSDFDAWRDADADPPALVVQVGKTQLRYQLRCIDDLHAMLKTHGDWMPLGSSDEQKPAAVGTVEAWGRDPKNPVKGWYGLKKGLRGRFGMYVPPVLEALGLAEVEHNAKNNRMRAK